VESIWSKKLSACDAVSGSEGEGIKEGEGRDVGAGATNLIGVRGEDASALAGIGRGVLAIRCGRG
jgi:hypothetical protein